MTTESPRLEPYARMRGYSTVMVAVAVSNLPLSPVQRNVSVPLSVATV